MIPVSLFSKLFPPPRYLEMPIVGLDISDQSIKCAEVILDKSKIVVRRIGERGIPLGAIEAGRIKDKPALEAALVELARTFKLSAVAVSLPEEQAFTIRMKLPAVKLAEIRSTIEFSLEEYVPIPAADAEFDYEIVERLPGGGYDVAVSILPKAMVADYTESLRVAGLEPLGMEIEGQALARSLIRQGDTATQLIVDIGKTRTGFSVVTQGAVAYTTTLNNIGGEDITKNIQKALGVSYEEAERLKIEKGLMKARSNQELFFALIPALSSLRDEINKLYAYWNTHKDESGLTRRRIETIILCGGQASLPGLSEYIGSGLPVPVELGNPWINILIPEETIPPLDPNQTLRYAVALGLALRNFEHNI